MTTVIPSMYSGSTTKNIRYVNLVLDTEKDKDAPFFNIIRKGSGSGYETVSNNKEIVGLLSQVSIRQETIKKSTGATISLERLSISLLARDENGEVATLYLNIPIKSGISRSIICSLMSVNNFEKSPIKFYCYRSKETQNCNVILYDLSKNEKIQRHPDYNLGDLWKTMTKKIMVNKEEKTDSSELDDHIKEAITILGSKPMAKIEVTEEVSKKDETQNVFEEARKAIRAITKPMSNNDKILNDVLSFNNLDNDLPF